VARAERCAARRGSRRGTIHGAIHGTLHGTIHGAIHGAATEETMHDLVFRGATLVDGTGAPACIADVAVDGGLVSAVRRRGPASLPGFERIDTPFAARPDAGPVGTGRREIDAHGLMLTPGFVDIHTHYDGQATWDAQLAPSSVHGVTTAVFGNCGVGFAPLRPNMIDLLINIMEGVEDIPGTVLAEGIPFGWETFPEYLDALDRLPHAIDIGAQVPHAALRCYVMGERGGDHAQRPTPRERDEMARLLVEALGAGALGLSTSRTVKHRARDGRPTPSLSAEEAELLALARAMRCAGRGVLVVNSDFGPGEFEVLEAAARASGRPLSLLLIQVDRAPTLWRETLDAIHAARAGGVDVNAQVGSRAIGVLLGLEATLNPFGTHPAWAPLAALPHAGRVARLRADAALRARLVDERPRDASTLTIGGMLERAFEMGRVPDYEPAPGTSIAARARESGRSPWALALDALLADEGRGLLLHPFENYTGGDLEVVRTMLEDDATVMGVGDGGAHVGTICDGSGPTFLLTHWARDRSRGRRIALERLVRKQTLDSARAYGLHDRGVVVPGMRADLNLIDPGGLTLHRPRIEHDLPAGGRRFLQSATGYRHTFVAGVETLRDDLPTGATPGRLVRAGGQAAGGTPAKASTSSR
jgi:N-acyl-D-aspartate/D-glutamate deacylase